MHGVCECYSGGGVGLAEKEICDERKEANKIMRGKKENKSTLFWVNEFILCFLLL